MKRLFLLSISFLVIGCTQPKSDPGARVETFDQSIEGEVIRQLSTNIILKTYQDLALRAASLRDQSQLLRTNRTQANLDRVAEIWKAGRESWEKTESFLFGPVESLSVDPLIDTWPLNVPDLNSILNSPSSITAAQIRTLGANLKGFHTIEYLVFGDGMTTNRKMISQFTPRQAEYLVAVAEVLAEDTAKLARAWAEHHDPDDPNSKAYVDLISSPGLDNPFYNSKTSVLVEFLNGMVKIADEVANGKIADPLGKSIDEANPAAEESPFSWNSVSDFSNNIRSIRMLYTGDNGEGQGTGLQKLLEVKNPSLAREVMAKIEASIAKILAIPGPEGLPFRKGLTDPMGRARIEEAQREVGELFTLLREKVLPEFK